MRACRLCLEGHRMCACADVCACSVAFLPMARPAPRWQLSVDGLGGGAGGTLSGQRGVEGAGGQAGCRAFVSLRSCCGGHDGHSL